MEVAPSYTDRLRALSADFDREKVVTVLSMRTGWSPRRFERMSNKKLLGWIEGEMRAEEVKRRWLH